MVAAAMACVNTMSEEEMQYVRLLDQVLEKAGCLNYSLKDIKEYFSKDIDSIRALSKAHSLCDVLKLLEERDVLSHRNVSSLHYLGELLQCSEIVDLVRVFKKLNLDIGDCMCITCGVNCEFIPPHLRINAVNEGEDVSTSDNLTNAELDEAVENIAKRIGQNWCVLARALKLVECEIDSIYESYPSDIEGQARIALQTWRRKYGNSATIEALDSALEERLCKVKGIGTHLRSRMCIVTR